MGLISRVSSRTYRCVRQKMSLNVCDPSLELVDPTPDVFKLFVEYDKIFFGGKLNSRCFVRWSTRMTLCAGICKFDGILTEIALSKPLLQLRPRSDCINTLLHEMIHAFLFLTQRIQDRDGHGPNFQEHMKRINKTSGSNITVYHTFHDEVAAQRQHIWQCNGPCRTRHPFYGKCARSMNRPPGKNDKWYSAHQQSCGGTWTKISEPPPKQKPKKQSEKKPKPEKKESSKSSKPPPKAEKKPLNTIDNYFKKSPPKAEKKPLNTIDNYFKKSPPKVAKPDPVAKTPKSPDLTKPFKFNPILKDGFQVKRIEDLYEYNPETGRRRFKIINQNEKEFAPFEGYFNMCEQTGNGKGKSRLIDQFTVRAAKKLSQKAESEMNQSTPLASLHHISTPITSVPSTPTATQSNTLGLINSTKSPEQLFSQIILSSSDDEPDQRSETPTAMETSSSKNSSFNNSSIIIDLDDIPDSLSPLPKNQSKSNLPKPTKKSYDHDVICID